MRSFLRGMGRVFSFGLVRSEMPAPLTPEQALEHAFADLDWATRRAIARRRPAWADDD